MKLRHYIASISVLSLPLTAAAENGSPWLPAPGQFNLGISHTQQTADKAAIGNTELSIAEITGGAATEYNIDTTSLQLEYGIFDSLSVDLSTAHTDVEAGSADNDSGRDDSVLGVNWRIADEFTSPKIPSVTLHAAAIIAGSYEPNRLAGIGKGADGFEVSVIVGKQFSPVFSLWGELGQQNRNNNVPDALFYNINAGVNFTSSLSGSVGYSNKEYDGNLDIGGTGFNPGRFAETSEERTLVKAAINYAFAQNQGFSVAYAQNTDGRNTVLNDKILSFSYSISFN